MNTIDTEGKTTSVGNRSIKAFIADGVVDICMHNPGARHNPAVAIPNRSTSSLKAALAMTAAVGLSRIEVRGSVGWVWSKACSMAQGRYPSLPSILEHRVDQNHCGVKQRAPIRCVVLERSTQSPTSVESSTDDVRPFAYARRCVNTCHRLREQPGKLHIPQDDIHEQPRAICAGMCEREACPHQHVRNETRHNRQANTRRS